ncbi:hypothetical protein CAPTEDRAFT_92345 [Capitella teleta]|uniref:FAD dependent oxidoreductase domain-containing protein n=1 Tax=Capitella teleta TaxID=283909 RepID=R7UGZ0_CAPTE|nr:hypothetical protein CAPTEDRAFT_92345 [Capitella teleta]|eukprot:ELU03058.1 hypothetical protein CAPTEDRAFT_92345 [Capitella teleta]
MSGGGVCVLGAGVVGLGVALRLLRTGNTRVTIVAEKFSPHTTGDGAAGIWEPYALGDTRHEDILRWGKETFDWIEGLAQSEEAADCGAFHVQCFHVYRENVQEPIWRDIVHGFRRMTAKELQPYPDHNCGFTYTTLISEGRKYLQWLTNRCKALGATFIQRKINDLTELSSFDIVVNCSGLGSRELARDTSVQPIKGQIIMVEAPWIKDSRIFFDEGLCLLIGTDRVYVGGTKEVGNEDATPNPVQSARIWREMIQLVPSLAKGKRIGEWGGLRPGRQSIRLEAEESNNSISPQVIHNYGHGGAGLTLHWGCAAECLRLIYQTCSPQPKL